MAIKKGNSQLKNGQVYHYVITQNVNKPFYKVSQPAIINTELLKNIKN